MSSSEQQEPEDPFGHMDGADWGAPPPIQTAEEAGEVEESEPQLQSMVVKDIQDAEEESKPEWFGVPWDEIDPMLQEEAWDYLRLWVDKQVNLYRLTATTLPPCWFEHRRHVEELYMALTLWEHVWLERSGPSMQPMIYWAEHVPGLLHRLREATDALSCGPSDTSSWEHKPDMHLYLDYDDGLWARRRATVREVKSLDREEEPYQADLGGDEVSRPVLVRPMGDPPAEDIRTFAPVTRGTGASLHIWSETVGMFQWQRQEESENH